MWGGLDLDELEEEARHAGESWRPRSGARGAGPACPCCEFAPVPSEGQQLVVLNRCAAKGVPELVGRGEVVEVEGDRVELGLVSAVLEEAAPDLDPALTLSVR